MNSQSLVAENLDVRIDGHLLVEDATIRCEPGQVVALLGPNGAGKSTLLSALAGTAYPSGRKAARRAVRLDGRPLADWRPNELARRRGVLRQRSRIPFGFTVRQVVEFSELPWRETNLRDATPGESQNSPSLDARDYLEAVGLADFGPRSFPTLSGGEKRRAQLARVMMQIRALESRPDQPARYLLLDEPLAGLDIAESARILGRIRALSRQGIGILCVFHDLNAAARVADRVVLMRHSRIVAQGSPASCLSAENLGECFATSVQVEHDAAGIPAIRALFSTNPDEVSLST
jgi:iron complex transport system ATP-binding protein